MPHFTLKQLKYFVAVVEAESIAEASRQLHIAQPSISIAVKTLEDMFEQQFFIRHHAQGVSMTPSGQRFYEKAKELLRLSSRKPIMSWSPGLFPSVVLRPPRRCICHR